VRFQVSSLGARHSDEKPVAGAMRAKFPEWDQRTFKTPLEHDQRLPHEKPWLSEGTEHEVNEHGIRRRLQDVDGWVIDLKDLRALKGLCEAHGEVAVSINLDGGLLLDLIDGAPEG
jgi:hypothetical protein